MDLPQGLPAVLHAKVAAVVHDVFQSSYDALEPNAGIPDTRDIESRLLVSVRAAIALEIKARLPAERPGTGSRRLPNELWSRVWGALPFLDRISVAKVCHHWRNTALSDVSFWARPTFYTAVHHVTCQCRHCLHASDGDGGKGPVGWVADPYPCATSNAPSAFPVLERSRTQPVDVTLDITPYRPNWAPVLSIIEALKTHSNRIARLHLRTATGLAVRLVCARLENLPALRSMTVDYLDNEADVFNEEEAYFSLPEAMPQLSSLSLDRHFDWPLRLRNSTLRSLSIAPESWTGISDVVKLCNQLTRLRVDLSLLADPDMTFCRRLRDGIARLPQLEVVNLPRDLEDWAVISFEGPERKTLALEYRPAPCTCTTVRRTGTVDSNCYDATAINGGAIFRDLRESVHLTLANGKAGHNRTVTIEGTDSAQRTRRVVLNACCHTTHGEYDLENVLARHTLAADSVTRLTVDVSLWPSFAHAMSLAPGIKAVNLILRAGADVATRRGFHKARNVLPALRELSLIAGRDDFVIHAQDVRKLLEQLQFPVVDSLHLDRTVFRGEHQALSDLSRAISVGYCHSL